VDRQMSHQTWEFNSHIFAKKNIFEALKLRAMLVKAVILLEDKD
jgi:hypothetical protein